MAATAESPRTVMVPYMPANTVEHDKDRAARQAERDKKRPVLRKCLDPRVAATYESRKPSFEWKVSASFDRPDPKTGDLESMTRERTVVAQTEKEAWAAFCDAIKAWPGPHNCERTITKLAKVN